MIVVVVALSGRCGCLDAVAVRTNCLRPDTGPVGPAGHPPSSRYVLLVAIGAEIKVLVMSAGRRY